MCVRVAGNRRANPGADVDDRTERAPKPAPPVWIAACQRRRRHVRLHDSGAPPGDRTGRGGGVGGAPRTIARRVPAPALPAPAPVPIELPRRPGSCRPGQGPVHCPAEAADLENATTALCVLLTDRRGRTRRHCYYPRYIHTHSDSRSPATADDIAAGYRALIPVCQSPSIPIDVPHAVDHIAARGRRRRPASSAPGVGRPAPADRRCASADRAGAAPAPDLHQASVQEPTTGSPAERVLLAVLRPARAHRVVRAVARQRLRTRRRRRWTAGG